LLYIFFLGFATNIGGVPFCSYPHRANVYVYYIKVHLLFSQLSLPVAVAVNLSRNKGNKGGTFNTDGHVRPTNVNKCVPKMFVVTTFCPANLEAAFVI